MLKHLPNALTCLNLFLGCVALYHVFQDQLVISAYLVFVAAVVDFLDGMVARLLHAYSEIGKQLDSMADMVSFGVVPGATLFMLLNRALGPGEGVAAWLPFVGFLVSVFSGLRLAKFNIDTRQTTSFIGLPTPACSILIVSLPLILADDRLGLSPFILHPVVLVALTVVLSYLLVAELPLFSLKFDSLRWQGNTVRYIFLGLSVLLLAFLQVAAIPLIILLYLILSLFNKTRT